MKILITGANGFIGKNLKARLHDDSGYEIDTFTRSDSVEVLPEKIRRADAIFHLAGINRPENPEEFSTINTGLSEEICSIISTENHTASIVFSSSAQVALDNPYGGSKLAAEKAFEDLARTRGNAVTVFRLPGVFGKWCRPDYNSVVATFCSRTTRGESLDIHDPDKVIDLVYIDDVVDAFIDVIENQKAGFYCRQVEPVYEVSLGQLAETIWKFSQSRVNLLTDNVGSGLERALYATYLSYMEPDQFSYPLVEHIDERGKFVEFLKTPEAGQISFFTAKPGVTRGGHYHHTKNEKFLIVKGRALFRFRHIESGACHELSVSADSSQVVETIPGWAHDITNTGDEELIVLLWANEVFDKSAPDTIGAPLDHCR